MSAEHAVTEFAEHFRGIIEQAWTDATAHADYRPLPEGFPASYGQCVSTSHILFQALQRRFPAEEFRLVRGRVLDLGGGTPRPVIDPHVWITWRSARDSHTVVIDATADQAQGAVLPPCLVAAQDVLEQRGIVYRPCLTFNGLRDLEAHCAKEEPHVRERISHLRARFQARAARFQAEGGRDCPGVITAVTS